MTDGAAKSIEVCCLALKSQYTFFLEKFCTLCQRKKRVWKFNDSAQYSIEFWHCIEMFLSVILGDLNVGYHWLKVVPLCLYIALKF